MIIQNYIPWDNTVADSAVGVIVSAKFVLSVTTVTRCGGVQSGKKIFLSFLDNTPKLGIILKNKNEKNLHTTNFQMFQNTVTIGKPFPTISVISIGQITSTGTAFDYNIIG